jgi:hypothetical protein
MLALTKILFSYIEEILTLPSQLQTTKAVHHCGQHRCVVLRFRLYSYLWKWVYQVDWHLGLEDFLFRMVFISTGCQPIEEHIRWVNVRCTLYTFQLINVLSCAFHGFKNRSTFIGNISIKLLKAIRWSELHSSWNRASSKSSSRFRLVCLVVLYSSHVYFSICLNVSSGRASLEPSAANAFDGFCSF